MTEGVVGEISDGRHVDISKSIETSCEVRWVVVSSEQTAKLRVEYCLGYYSVKQIMYNIFIPHLQQKLPYTRNWAHI